MSKLKILLLLSVILFSWLNTSAQEELGAFPALERGNSNARISLEVFVDFQCPACVPFNTKLREIEKKFPNDLRVIIRQYPLTQIHSNALLAAQATEAAAMQEKFLEMSDLLFEKHDEWTQEKDAQEKFINYAKSLGLDVETFKLDLESRQVKDRINADIKRGDALNVRGIPTAYLNGKELSFSDLQELEKIIEETLKK